MVDMTPTIIAKSDQVTADDLISGPRTITVTRATANEANADQPVNIFFEGDDGKPFRPCKSMRRVMVQVWGKDAAKYAGKSLTIYRDPKVKWGGMEVGGVRISHMSDMDAPKTVALQATRGKKVTLTVKPLKVEPKTDKVAEGVKTLIERIKSADDVSAIEEQPAVIKQRAWLNENRPELAHEVDNAINAASVEASPFEVEAE